MTRDEVLKAIEIAAEEASAAAVGLKCTGQGRAATWYSQQADLLRAAAEIIRESGWRPIAEAPDIIPPGRLGWWGAEKWYEVVTQYPIPKLNASTLGYTHYCPLDKPEPPAREESKSKNGEENDRQNQDNKCIG